MPTVMVGTETNTAGSGSGVGGSYVAPGKVAVPSPTAVSFQKIPKPKNTKFKPIATPDPLTVGKIQTSPVGFNSITPGASNYSDIQVADYHKLDPAQFAAKYGETVRSEMSKNLPYAQGTALSTLNTELQGLKNYAPAAATLKRSEVSADNQFNQAQRTQQVNQALPGAERDLLDQNKRANAYATGKLPSGFDDASLELQLRSEAADKSAAGGFGVNSAAAHRASGLMSATQRLGIAQYGEGLLTNNIGTRSNLYLAPTEYSDAGNQIRVTPEVGAGRLTSGYLADANNMGIVSASTALSSSINQEQFGTNLQQQTNQFNASNQLQNSQFNVSTDQARQGNNQRAQMATDQFNSNQNVATQGQNIANQYAADTYNQQTGLNLSEWNTSTRLNNANNNRNRNVSIDEFNSNGAFQASQANANAANNFKLAGFQYEVGYQGAIAGTANANTNLGIQQGQQQQAMDTFSSFLNQGQQAGTVGSIGQGLGTILGATSIGSNITSALGLGGNNGGGGGGNAGSIGGGGSSAGGVSGGGNLTQPAQPVGGATNVGAPQAPSGGGAASGGFQAPAQIITPGEAATNPGSITEGGANVSPFTTPGFQPSGGFGSVMTSPDAPSGGSEAYGAPSVGDYQDQSLASSGKIASFDGTVGDGLLTKTLQNDPQAAATRAQLGSTSSAVLGAAGISDTPGPGMTRGNVTSDGRQTYVAQTLQQSNNPQAGSNVVGTLGGVLEPFGVFNGADKDTWSQVAKTSSDANFLTQLTQLQQAGDTKGFVNLAMQKFGEPAVEKLTKDPQNKAGVSTAFAAFNLAQNWDQMSSTQKSLGLAALGMKAFKFGTGEDLATKSIIKPGAPGDPGLNVGQALNLLSTGVNVYSLAKNWDQLNTMQKIVYGTGDAAQMATTARNMGLLGSGTGGTAVAVNPKVLAAAGWSSAPNVGVGAMSAPAGTQIPDGFTQVPASTRDGSVVAIPKGNAGSAAPSTVDQFAGGVVVAAGALNTYKGWGTGGLKGATQGAAGGSAMAAGLSTLGEKDPYILGAVVGTSILGGAVGMSQGQKNVTAGIAGAGLIGVEASRSGAAAVGSGTQFAAMGKPSTAGYISAAAEGVNAVNTIFNGEGTGKQRASRAQQQIGLGVADIWTGGAASSAEGLLRSNKVTGGVLAKADALDQKYNPATLVGGKLIEGSGKSGDQQDRDLIRSGYQKAGLSDDKHKVTLADGSTYDIGIDGHGAQHEFSHPDKLPAGAENRKLNAWDVDYTNDLDYTAAMGGSALSRMLSGGKSKGSEQMGGQLANAAIGNVGFGKDMTPLNFSKTMDNLRGMYSKAGIKSKEDAFQLINQGYAEGRWNESDMVAMQQASNMVFNKDFSSASKLMQGRWKGIEVLSKTPTPTPGEKNPGNTLDHPTPSDAFGLKGTDAAKLNTIMSKATPGVSGDEAYFTGNNQPSKDYGFASQQIRPGYVPKSTKLEARQMNLQKYAGGVA